MNQGNQKHLKGGDGRIIRNTLWTPTLADGEKPKGTAVFLPGYQYPPEAPLFFYLQGVFIDQGWAVLSVDYRYNENEKFSGLGTTEKAEYLRRDADSIFAGLVDVLGNGNACFTAKSLGTTLLFHMASKHVEYFKGDQVQCLWLTPAGENERIEKLLTDNPLRSGYVIGTGDPWYDVKSVKTLAVLDHVRLLIQDGSGHALEKKGDILQSICNLEEAVSFLDSCVFG